VKVNGGKAESTILVEDIPVGSGIRLLDGTNVAHEFPVHIHDSYILGLVTRGERHIYAAGADYLIRNGEGFIISPGVPHSCVPATENGHDYRVISLETDLMKAASIDVFGREKVPYFSIVKLSENTLINQLIKMMKSVDNRTVNRDDVLSVLSLLIRRYADTEDPAAISESRIHLAGQARDYINAHLMRTISLDELAAENNVSPYYLERVFREVVGVPPHVYQLQTRIKKAIDTLLKTGSIIDASYFFGFSDQSHFSRIFKKNVGVSPGRFIKTNKKRMP